MSNVAHRPELSGQGPSGHMSPRASAAHAAGTMAGLALAIWVFGRIVFVHAGLGTLPQLVEVQPMGWCLAAVAGCAVAAIAAGDTRTDDAGTLVLALLLLATLTIWQQLHDPSMLVLALLLIACHSLSPARIAVFGVGAMGAATLFVGALWKLPIGFAGATPLDLAQIPFASQLVVPRLLFAMLASLSLVVWDQRRRLSLAMGCVAATTIAAVRYDHGAYAFLMLLLGASTFATALKPRQLARLAGRPQVRRDMAVAPIVFGCLVYDLATVYHLDVLGTATGAYASYPPRYGLALVVALAALYVRTVLRVKPEPKAGADAGPCALWTVFALYALALAFDADAGLVESNLPLLLLARGFGPAPAAAKGKRRRDARP